jgi:hypothetical protein
MIEALGDLVASGRIVDLILILVAIEFAALWIYRKWRGNGPDPRSLFFNLVAGSALLLALRASLHDAAWQTIAGFLAVAFAAHLADLGCRWRR